MSKFSERLDEMLKERGLKASELARLTDIPESAISSYRSGKYEAKQRRIHTIAKALNTTPAYLMGVSDVKEPYFSVTAPIPQGFEPLPKMVKVPLVGFIACGEPILAEENIEDYVEMPASLHANFSLRCKGDSMIDARINDGDIVFVKAQPVVENGEIAAVRIGDEATLKKVFYEDGGIMLVPCNDNYKPLVFMGNDAESVHIEGKAIAFMSRIK